MGTVSPLLVADQAAFENDDLRVVFLDKHANIVVHSTCAPHYMAELHDRKTAGRLTASQWWEYGEVGPLYRSDGEMMQRLRCGDLAAACSLL